MADSSQTAVAEQGDANALGSRIDFLERALGAIRDDADRAEENLRLNPGDQRARERLELIYILAQDLWDKITTLKAAQAPERRPRDLLH